MRRPGLTLGAALALLVIGAAAARARRLTRVAVSGHSMAPTLEDGDWLLVAAADDYVPGDVVVARDPRAPGRLLVKRVAAVTAAGDLLLTGDHPAHRHDEIPPVPRAAVAGRVQLRYWPARRFGLVRGSRLAVDE